VHSRYSAAALALLLSASPPGTPEAAQSRKDADSLAQKLFQIVSRGQKCPCPRRLSTAITESEVNAYIVHYAAADLPDGVVSPQITIVGDGRVAGRATVDLDRVRTSRQRGWLDPAGYLTGRLPVTVAGILHTQNGIGKFELQSAAIGGVTVPKVVLQELLSYYSRTPEDPDGLNLDDTFELPAKIREIQVGKGVAYVVQ
jgi:hypothetical protein